MRRLAVVAVIVVLAGCTPAQVAAWTEWHQSTQTCHGAVDALWPANSRSWAHRIVNRESGGRPTAQNRRSSAAGCFQLVKVHAGRFAKVGYSWSDRYDAAANTLAALDLYRSAGSRPWR